MYIGHLAFSYILSQLPRLWGRALEKRDVLLVVIAGIILDWDLIIAVLIGLGTANHHVLPTHTPLFASLLFVLGFLVFRCRYSSLTLKLAGAALFFHLVLDDIGYWFYKLGLQQESSYPQIFWLYPFDQRRQAVLAYIGDVKYGGLSALYNYLTRASLSVFVELALVLVAVLLFFRSRKQGDEKS
jgi:hypothetical protein